MNKNFFAGFRIAGTVIVYHPPPTLIDNIKSFIDSVDLLIIINNGDWDLSTICNLFPRKKIQILNFPNNIGVASGLNKAAEVSINNQIDYLLFMDQDSFALDDVIGKYIDYLGNNQIQNLGLLSPIYLYKDYKAKSFNGRFREVKFALTSGSFLCLETYKKVGAFLDKLFIDYIDFEYCLRLKKNGYKIVQLNDVFIQHNLGKIVGRKILFKQISVTHHSPERYYYRTRNRFYVYQNYFLYSPSFVVKDLVVFINELVKIIFYEKEKVKKFRMIIFGFYHFITNHYGKYSS